MAIDFKVRDVIHRIITKFFPAFLPNATKKYYARSVLETPLDVHGIASKADVYNITTSPRVIEEGLTAGIQLITYLVADGYKIKTDLVNMGIRVPGEYDGTETRLPEGVRPEVRVAVAAALRKYIGEHVQIVFDGVEELTGMIGEVKDEATGQVDEVITTDNIVTVRGYGLKVDGDVKHAAQVGVFLVDENQQETPVKAVALNEPRTLKLLMPAGLTAGAAYTLLIRTQSVVKGGGLLKDLREVRSDFPLTAQ
jgi:glycerol-3-phosphate responsive antiterminator